MLYNLQETAGGGGVSGNLVAGTHLGGRLSAGSPTSRERAGSSWGPMRPPGHLGAAWKVPAHHTHNNCHQDTARSHRLRFQVTARNLLAGFTSARWQAFPQLRPLLPAVQPAPVFAA